MPNASTFSGYPRLRGRYPGGAGEQRLAAQPLGDAAGLVDRLHGGVQFTHLAQELGVVEQAMREVIWSTHLAEATDRGGVACGGLVAVMIGQASPDKVAFGPQDGGQVSRWMGVEHREQLVDRGCVA